MISTIASSTSFLAPIADIFSRNKSIIWDIDVRVTSNPEDTTLRWIVWWWITTVKPDNNDVLSPRIVIQKAHATNYTVLLHEYVHAITHPYILAWDILEKNAYVDIPDSNIKQNVINHYNTIKSLYEEAQSKGYKTINGESVEESIAEFCANITNKKSTEALKSIWIYDRLIAEIERHTKTVTTLKIPLITKNWAKIIWKNE